MMQCAGKRNRSPLKHITTLNAIIEKQRCEGKKTFVFFAYGEKCFDKLWLEDRLIELEKMGWNCNGLMMLSRLNETAKISQDPIICCTETAQVNKTKFSTTVQVISCHSITGEQGQKSCKTLPAYFGRDNSAVLTR